MNRHLIWAVVAVLVSLIAGSAPSRASWPPDGILVCGAENLQSNPKIVSDGAGGMIVAWQDERSPDYNVFAQRIDGSGVAMWHVDGKPMTGKDQELIIDIVPDGAGGAVLVWINSGTNDLFACRIGPDGSFLWGQGGVVVTAYNESMASSEPVIAADGTGGLILAWTTDVGGDLVIIAQKLDANGVELWSGSHSFPGVQVSLHAVKDEPPRLIADGAGGALLAFIADVSERMVFAQRIFPSGALWDPMGVGLSTELGEDFNPAITRDGAGGAFVAWQNRDNDLSDIYARRVDAGGTVQWAEEARICVLGGHQQHPDILSDGAGGACVAWQDRRGGALDIYAQRVDAYGNVLWTENGMPVCEHAGDQYEPVLVRHDMQHIIVAWPDLRSTGSLYAQKLDIAGLTLWQAGGVKVLDGILNEYDYDLAADGSGGFMATVMDDRLAAYGDIYAQSINCFGDTASAEPAIAGIDDVPGDQGGAVRITIARSDRDDIAQTLEPITSYDVWQRIDDPVAVEALLREASPGRRIVVEGSSGARGEITLLESETGRYVVAAPASAFPEGTWELVGSFGASQSDEYLFRAATLADSTAAGTPWSVYTVAARTTNPLVWFVSAPDSGYSVDNLAPAPPLGLAGEQTYEPAGLRLTWDPNTEDDLWYYGVHRGTDAGFEPEPGNLVATPVSGEWFDGGWSWEAGYWYKVSAVDRHGNGSLFAVLGPAEVTGDEPVPVPDATFLAQNVPNPFNPSTTIAFGLKERSRVSLRIYDAAGRLVATLLDGTRPAGRYSIEWDGRGADGVNAASGVYFYRLRAGTFEETKKMILLR